MLCSSLIVCVGVVVANVAASPSPSFIVHEKTPHDPQWVKVKRAPANAVWPVRVGLIQNNLERGPELLEEV
jgi:tripeptidyl-peptidase I